MSAKRILKALYEERADLLRGLVMLCIFRPAGWLLPRQLLWPLSVTCAVPMVSILSAGRRAAREHAAAFGLTRFEAWRCVVRSCAKRFNEFAVQEKMINGMYKPWKCSIDLEASEAARAIIEGPGSFVLGQAHFERTAAAAAVFKPSVLGDRYLYIVAAKMPVFIPQPHLWRSSVQLRQVLRSALAIRPNDREIVYTGGAFAGLVENMRTGRVVVSLNIDAPWGRGRSSSFIRPFAGRLRRTFSTGAGRLARLAGCPLLMALPLYDSRSKRVRMRIFGPFQSNATEPDQHDQDLVDQMLNTVEREIGERPSDYVMEIGGERRWDPRLREWGPLPVPAGAPALAVRAGVK